MCSTCSRIDRKAGAHARFLSERSMPWRCAIDKHLARRAALAPADSAATRGLSEYSHVQSSYRMLDHLAAVKWLVKVHRCGGEERGAQRWGNWRISGARPPAWARRNGPSGELRGRKAGQDQCGAHRGMHHRRHLRGGGLKGGRRVRGRTHGSDALGATVRWAAAAGIAAASVCSGVLRTPVV